MLNSKHRHKLIEGLVGAMGSSKPERKPKVVVAIGAPPSEEEEEEDLESAAESEPTEAGDDEEAMKCARDLARALDMGSIDDTKAKAIAEAIKSIVGGYG